MDLSATCTTSLVWSRRAVIQSFAVGVGCLPMACASSESTSGSKAGGTPSPQCVRPLARSVRTEFRIETPSALGGAAVAGAVIEAREAAFDRVTDEIVRGTGIVDPGAPTGSVLRLDYGYRREQENEKLTVERCVVVARLECPGAEPVRTGRVSERRIGARAENSDRIPFDVISSLGHRAVHDMAVTLGALCYPPVVG